MPKNRFFNLPQEKRTRIVEAAIEELSQVPYDQMSINRIIQAASIPRGSFYQYFEDKFDLLDYVMKDYKSMMEERTAHSFRDSGGNPFEICRTAMNCAVEFATDEENLRFCRHVFPELKVMDFLSFEVDIVKEINLNGQLRQFAQSNFQCASDEDIKDLLEILIDIFRSTVAQLVMNIEKKDKILLSYENKLRLLENGVMNQRLERNANA